MVYNVAVVGGGFSGLCAAVMLGFAGIKSVALFDANKRLGKKIQATGNGQGNLTNADMTIGHYHGDKAFAENALSRYGKDEMLDFFTRLGLLTTEKDGKIYPASFCASSISDVLRFAVEKCDTEQFIETRIVNIIKEKGVFVLTSQDGRKFTAKKVVLAFGGSSGDGFFTDGKSYPLAVNFGHKITDLSPSLVQIKTERGKIRGLKGIKQQAKVTLLSGEKTVRAFSGDLLFTDYGISGNSVFSLSAYLKGVKNPVVKIEFLPDRSYEKLCGELINKVKLCGDCTCENLLVSVLPTRLAQTVITESGLKLTDKATARNAEKIARTVKNFTLKADGTAGFKAAQVTAGGIDCKDVDSATMESKLTDGLYITGEALNVDGDCGGYNLQWAYTSAAACANAIISAEQIKTRDDK